LGLVASRLSNSEGKYLISRLASIRAAFPFPLTAIFCWHGTTMEAFYFNRFKLSSQDGQ